MPLACRVHADPARRSDIGEGASTRRVLAPFQAGNISEAEEAGRMGAQQLFWFNGQLFCFNLPLADPALSGEWPADVVRSLLGARTPQHPALKREKSAGGEVVGRAPGRDAVARWCTHISGNRIVSWVERPPELRATGCQRSHRIRLLPRAVKI